MNVKKLKSKMVLCGDEDFVLAIAKVLGKSRQTASNKLNGVNDFTQPEIAQISKHYNLTDREVYEIFIEGDINGESERSSEVIR